MAIQNRRGNFADFDPYKMLAGEFAYALDTEELYYCVSPGNIKRCATKEEVIEILETNEQAYDGLQQLLLELENETVATGILNDIADLILKSDKNENDIAKINDRHIGTNLISPSSDAYKNLNFSLGESYLGRIDNGLVGGKPITISTILKDMDFFYDGIALRIYFYDESDVQLDFKTGTYATEDGLYSFTAMIPTGAVYAEIYALLPMSYTVDSDTKYKCLKAELGGLATPWKPSIYDLYNEVSTHLAESVTQGNPHGIDAKADKAQGSWKVATMFAGWTGSVQYRKNSLNIVTVSCAGLKPGTITGLTVIATLPVGYRPKVNVPITLINPSGSVGDFNFYLNPNGNIYIAQNSTLSTSDSYGGQFSFELEEV